MGKKVLIVDDAVFMRMMLRDILEKNGYEISGEASNGYEAIEAYQNNPADVVTMDVTMPEMDGLKALIEIRKIDPAAKVIMCSAMGQQAMVMDAIKAGAKDFIVKPFNGERVIEAVGKVLG